MANYMAEVAKLLGVELGEEFEIDYGRTRTSTANITKTGLHIINTNMVDFLGDLNRATLDWLLIGNCTIKRKPWKPECAEVFWYVDDCGNVKHRQWVSLDCDNFYKIGNCYCTREEAYVNRKKWVAFYASDEVLEV